MLPSGDGVEIASIEVRSTSSNGKTNSKKSEGGMNAASSSHNTSPPDPRNVFDAAGYELTMLFSPVPGWRKTRISALLFTMSLGSTTLATNPLISSNCKRQQMGIAFG